MGITNRNPHSELVLSLASTAFASVSFTFPFDSERRVSTFKPGIIFYIIKKNHYFTRTRIWKESTR